MNEPTNWADVALALIEFAREEPGTFSLMCVFLLLNLVSLLFILYRLLPGTTRELAQLFKAMREAGRKSGAMDGDDSAS